MYLRILRTFWFLIILLIAPSAALSQSTFGFFSGNPTAALDPDGIHITLLQNFSFTDDKQRIWIVPQGYKSDGASIPQAFWSFIGGPLTGQFRNAAIIHDYFCDRRAHPWQEVHQVFYKGMRAGGLDQRKAWVMYKAVYYFGPRWEKKIEIPKECSPGPNFSPEDCVLNSEPKVTVYKNPLTNESFNGLLDELKKDGYEAEANELKKSVKF
jgi:hypothetical protein